MLLKDYLQQLAMGPVGELTIAGEGSGTLPELAVPRMIIHLNSALTALHTRFCLRKETLSMVTLSSRNAYPLIRAHALTSGSSEPDKFIIDSVAKPFLGDLLGIEGVFDADHAPLNLNVKGDQYGWHTSKFNTLTMGYPVTGETYFIQYRQGHPTIAADADRDITEIQIPPSLESALLLKVAHLVYGAMTGDNAVMKANGLMQEYEQACAMNDVVNLVNVSETDVRAERFCRDGWT